MKPTDHQTMTSCTLCPRKCGVDRTHGQTGVCGMTHELRVARIAPHMWEEPPISGSRGSGTVFFTGCSLRCIFCQNRVISREGLGKSYTAELRVPSNKSAACGKKIRWRRDRHENLSLLFFS